MQEMDTESGEKVAMGWCCALLGYHYKVTLRSSLGHCKVKLTKNMIFYIFYRLLSTHYWSDTISPHIARGLYAISALGITPLVFPLSHPFPKAGENQQNY